MSIRMADVRPSVLSLLIVTLMSIVGTSLLRWAVARYPNVWPGFTTLVNAA